MEKIKLGIATSATQIEGRNIRSSWHDFARDKNIKDLSSPSYGVNHLEHLKDDLDLLCSLNIKEYRMSIEWAAINTSEGVYVDSIIEEYVEEIKSLTSRGINVMVCFHHFTNPSWFDEKGSWLVYENIHFFIDYVKHILPYFKDLVSEYLTFNEPSIYALQSYLLGIWPPLVASYSKYKKVISNMAHAHILLYKHIHNYYSDLEREVFISIAHSHGVAFGAKYSLLGSLSAKVYKKIYNDYTLDSFYLGNFKHLKNNNKEKKGKYVDFIGLNYYSVSFFKGFKVDENSKLPKTDLNWNIYPEGIIIAIKEILKKLKLPIYITENGTCDNTDSFRIPFIYNHLSILEKSGLDVRRYYHWCFTDNFEWKEGYTPKFGLVEIDKTDLKRTIKRSGLFYSYLVTHELQDEKILEYLK
ncbi:MAG: family 1 glycosylhydrolase [Acholeplasmatales bacterium]|jgi:beta-glucosidase|nr:family 1 glycosylhydrolase [Acholeplasmatales bacterium]